VAIVASGGLVHLPFNQPTQFASTFPEGIAVGRVALTGDASGGIATTNITADGHFLYRLENFQVSVLETISDEIRTIIEFRWAADASGLGPSFSNFSYWLIRNNRAGTVADTIYELDIGRREMIKRLPIGRLDDVQDQTIWTIQAVNSNGRVWTTRASFAYWPQSAMYRPGFLSSFWEAPIPLQIQ